MPGGTMTSEAMSDFALWASECLLLPVVPDNEVIAVSRRTLKIVPRKTSLHNHLPLESLPFSKTFFVQEHFKVILRRQRVFTARVWALYRKLAHWDLSLDILSQTIFVKDALAASNTVNILILISVEKSHKTDVACTIIKCLPRCSDIVFLLYPNRVLNFIGRILSLTTCVYHNHCIRLILTWSRCGLKVARVLVSHSNHWFTSYFCFFIITYNVEIILITLTKKANASIIVI